MKAYKYSSTYYCVNNSRQIQFIADTGELEEFNSMSFYNIVTQYTEFIINIPKPLLTLLKLRGLI